MLKARSVEQTHALGMQRTCCFLLWLLTFYPDRDTNIYRRTKSRMVTRVQRVESPYAVASFNFLGRVKSICRGGRRAFYVTQDLRHCCEVGSAQEKYEERRSDEGGSPPQPFFHKTTGLRTSFLWYLLKYSVPEHADVIDR